MTNDIHIINQEIHFAMIKKEFHVFCLLPKSAIKIKITSNSNMDRIQGFRVILEKIIFLLRFSPTEEI